MQVEREGLHESYMEEEMQNRQSFGFLRFAFVYIWKKKNFHHLRLYLEMNTDHADAAFARLSAVLMA